MKGVAIPVLCLGLAACYGQPLDTYSTLAARVTQRHQGYQSWVQDSDQVRDNFKIFLVSTCLKRPLSTNYCPMAAAQGNKQVQTVTKGGSKANPETTTITTTTPIPTPNCLAPPSTPAPSSYDAWLLTHPDLAYCTNAVITRAIDECVAVTGSENKSLAKAGIAFGTAYAIGGLAADAAALSHPGSSSTLSTAALATAITSGATNVHGLVPATSTVATQSLVQNAQAYVTVAGFSDSDSTCFAKGSCSSEVYLRYSRLHDAVIAACASGYY